MEGRHPDVLPDPDESARTVLPALRGVSARDLAKRSGLSVQQCSEILSGNRVPHPMHWGTLRARADAAEVDR
jgi:hypothetical protein